MPNKSALKISVICPFYNEEAIIEAATERTIQNLVRDFGGDWELILVNDGSTDDSVKNLLTVLDKHKAHDIKVVGAPYNQGRGRALKYGIDAASAPIIVTTEADCSWGDDIAKKLYDKLEAEPHLDFVIASPHRAGGKLVNVSASRVLLTKWGNIFIRCFFDSNITMNTGMTRGYRKDVIQPLVTNQNGKEFHLEVLLKLITLGFTAGEIPAVLEWQDHKLQKTGTKKRVSTTRIFKTVFTHLQFVAIAKPMKYFTLLAAFFLMFGMGFVGWAFVNLFVVDQPSAFAAITGLASFIISLILGGFAVLFSHLRDMMRELWTQSYDRPYPPSVRPAQIFHNIADVKKTVTNAKGKVASGTKSKSKSKSKAKGTAK